MDDKDKTDTTVPLTYIDRSTVERLWDAMDPSTSTKELRDKASQEIEKKKRVKGGRVHINEPPKIVPPKDFATRKR